MNGQARRHEEKPDYDQRYIPRWEVENRVVYQMPEDPLAYEGITKDISCTGACVAIDPSVLPTQDLKLTIYLSRDSHVELKGKIVWTKTEKGQKKIGIHFYNVSAQAADSLLEHAFEVDKNKLQDHWFKGWQGGKN